MKITFLYWGYENPGIEALSAYLKQKGHQTNLAFDPALFNTFHLSNRPLKKIFDIRKKLVERTIEANPDLICISSLSEDYEWASSMAQAIKLKKNIPIIMGGKHPTSVPEKVLNNDFIDFVCIGEGEEALSELTSSLEKGENRENILNIWLKKQNQIIKNPLRPLIKDLDSLPFADKDLFYNEYSGFKKIYTISTSRGCPYTCTYCHNNLLRRLYKDNGPYLRRRSVDKVIAELKQAKEKYQIKRIYFLDEIFVYDIAWLRDFSKKYKKEINLPFGCEVYSSFVNQEVVSLLEESGCLAVDMGIQTTDENIRSKILKRPGSNEEIKRAISLFGKTKIFIYVGVILGLPEQNDEEALNIARFLNKHKPDLLLSSWLRYYPRTEIVDIARKKNIISDKDIRKIEEEGDFSPFVRCGHTFNKNLAKIAHLILISPFISASLLNFLIEKKIYRLFPAKLLFWHLNLNSLLMTWYKNIVEKRKKLLYFTVSGQLKFIATYMVRRFKI
jgi:radical SAM superfamily enzyme YgiQ (UPF0313 family)